EPPREIPWHYETESGPRALARELASSPAVLGKEQRVQELESIRRCTEELGRRLLPQDSRLFASWKGVYVVGADMLGGTPLEALSWQGQELGRAKAVCYLPSIPVGLALARRRAALPRGDLDQLLVAAPTLPDDGTRASLAEISFDDATRRTLSAGYARTTVLTGKEATRSRLVEALARGPRVLDFLVHGGNDLYRELTGYLRLAPESGHPDGRLWCEDVLALDCTSPELVLLGACGSACGPQ